MIGVVLAGGKGTRLGADPVSKPMVDVGGRPLYTYGVDALASLGCKELIIEAGGNADLVEDVYVGSTIAGCPVSAHAGGVGTILGDLARNAPFSEDVAMVFGDEWYDLDAVRAFRLEWNGVKDAQLFFVHGEGTAKKTYTAIGVPDYSSANRATLRVHRLVEKPVWVPSDRPFGPIAGTGLAIVKKEIANAASAIASHRDWVDLFQLAIDSGKNVTAIPFVAAYFNVNAPDDLAALREFVVLG
jgi:NDP-sugar pyrophosphorylase family protein